MCVSPPRDFGPADSAAAFTSLAAHMNAERRTHSAIPEQALFNAGVFRCPVAGCGKYCSTVGKRSEMVGHLAHGDSAHRAHFRGEQGGAGGWVRALRQQAEPLSPAHYFNTLHYSGNETHSSLPRRRAAYKRATALPRQPRQSSRPGGDGVTGAADGYWRQRSRAEGLRARDLAAEICAPGARAETATGLVAVYGMKNKTSEAAEEY